MARGKHLSLEEARKEGLLDQFAKEHPAEGDEALFDRLLNAMASGKSPEEIKAEQKRRRRKRP